MAAKKKNTFLTLYRGSQTSDFSQSPPQRTYRRHTRSCFFHPTLHCGLPLHKEAVEVVRIITQPKTGRSNRISPRPLPPDRTKMISFHFSKTPCRVCPPEYSREITADQRAAAPRFLEPDLNEAVRAFVVLADTMKSLTVMQAST